MSLFKMSDQDGPGAVAVHGHTLCAENSAALSCCPSFSRQDSSAHSHSLDFQIRTGLQFPPSFSHSRLTSNSCSLLPWDGGLPFPAQCPPPALLVGSVSKQPVSTPSRGVLHAFDHSTLGLSLRRLPAAPRGSAPSDSSPHTRLGAQHSPPDPWVLWVPRDQQSPTPWPRPRGLYASDASVALQPLTLLFLK